MLTICYLMSLSKSEEKENDEKLNFRLPLKYSKRTENKLEKNLEIARLPYNKLLEETSNQHTNFLTELLKYHVNKNKNDKIIVGNLNIKGLVGKRIPRIILCTATFCLDTSWGKVIQMLFYKVKGVLIGD